MVREAFRDGQGSGGEQPWPGRGAYTAAVDSGVPQTSKRTGTEVAGAVAKGVAAKAKAKAKPADAKGTSAKPTGHGSARSGPVDPRTEDASSPNGLSRAGKTLWRRPGALAPRTTEIHEGANPDAPVDFAVALPLAPQATDPPIAKVADPFPELVIAPAAPAPTVEPTIDESPGDAPAADAPTALVPTVLPPSEAPPEQDVTALAP
ncbi:MAG: hypothetical protein QOJ74_391, partial [Ilumatobacteraceae bacterium]|nr:hypothetical protein [Ilumatobacteraceae bacterium]